MKKNIQIKNYIDDRTNEQLKYWASKKEMSRSEYVNEAIIEKIARENGDYDLPTLEIARLNEIIDTVSGLKAVVVNLESSVTKGLDSLIGLTRGDNYLLDEDE